jgi:energy-coupling factor transporter ATP-binding protein EcfA2
MKILKLELRRFKSIQEVKLPEDNSSQLLGNLNILIGRNSSGKSNILESLDYFFKEFDPALEKPLGVVNPELWFDRITKDPIQWDLTLSLNPEEIATLFGRDLLPLVDSIQHKDNVVLTRQIVATPQDMRWRTINISVGYIDLVKDMQSKPPEEIGKQLSSSANTAVPPNFVQTIMGNLSSLLRTQFKYILSARDNVQTPPSFGLRSPNINATELSQINTLAQGTSADVRRHWTPLRGEYEALLPHKERVDSAGGQLFLNNTPIWATGGGNQSMLSLVYEIETGPSIMAIEEPENHLHPEMVKNILRYFQSVTQPPKSKQLFISTHSPFLADTNSIKNIVALYLDKGKTTAKELASKEDLRNALFNIGARPSDILFADLVIIVEGESDKIVLQNWARTLAIPLEDTHASVIPARGVGKTKYHLKLWAEVAKGVGLPTYIFIDKDGENEAAKVIKEGLISQENTHVLELGSIEEYYPIDVLINCLQDLFTLTVTEEQISVGDRSKAISKLLKKEPEDWKVILAEEVSKRTDSRHIPREIGDFLRRVHNANA